MNLFSDIEVISFDLDNTLYDYEHSFKIAIDGVFNTIIKKYPDINCADLELTYNKLRADAEELAFRVNKTLKP